MKVIKNKKRTAMSLVMVITMTLMMLVASSASAFATQAYGFNFRVETQQTDGRVKSPVHYRYCDIRPAAKSLNIRLVRGTGVAQGGPVRRRDDRHAAQPIGRGRPVRTVRWSGCFSRSARERAGIGRSPACSR